MTEIIRLTICSGMAILCLLATFGLDQSIHTYLEENGRVDLAAQFNGAKRWLFVTFVVFLILCFL